MDRILSQDCGLAASLEAQTSQYKTKEHWTNDIGVSRSPCLTANMELIQCCETHDLSAVAVETEMLLTIAHSAV